MVSSRLAKLVVKFSIFPGRKYVGYVNQLGAKGVLSVEGYIFHDRARYRVVIRARA